MNQKHPLVPVIGHYKDGRPIYAMAGGDPALTANGEPVQPPAITPAPTGANPLEESGPRIKELGAQLKAAIDVMQESKDTDTARWQKAKEESDSLAKTIHEVKEKQDADERVKATDAAVEGMNELLASLRKPSAKAAIGGNIAGNIGRQAEYVRGSFIGGISDRRSFDAEAQARGKAALDAIGASFMDVPEYSAGQAGKATLGDSDAAGGFIVPNNLVDEMVKVGEYMNPYRGIVTTVNGVYGPGVDIPYRSAAVVAAPIAAWGAIKDNRDQTYEGATATLYTYAAIYDIGKQFARNSRGAAEQDVMATLAEAHAKAEANAIINGTGTAEPLGVIPALIADGNSTVAHTPATTLAGSVLKALAACGGHLAGKNRNGGLTAVMHAERYWQMLAEGTEEAGFFFNPAGGANALPGVPAGTLVSPWGVPVLPDNIVPNGATAPMVVGQWKSLKVYYGAGYRVDSSDVAGERWDRNLVGYRGEQEFGLNAEPAVATGAFAYVADINPAV